MLVFRLSFAVFSAFIISTVCQDSKYDRHAVVLWPEKVDCNRITGKMGNFYIPFARPMEVGDSLTIEGRFLVMERELTSINLLYALSYKQISLYMRFDPLWILYTDRKNGVWGKDQWSPEVYTPATPFKLVIKRFADHYKIYNDEIYMHTWIIQHPLSAPVQYLFPFSNVEVDAVQMDCARSPPPPPTYPPTYPPPPPPPAPTEPPTWSRRPISWDSSDEGYYGGYKGYKGYDRLRRRGGIIGDGSSKVVKIEVRKKYVSDSSDSSDDSSSYDEMKKYGRGRGRRRGFY